MWRERANEGGAFRQLWPAPDQCMSLGSDGARHPRNVMTAGGDAMHARRTYFMYTYCYYSTLLYSTLLYFSRCWNDWIR